MYIHITPSFGHSGAAERVTDCIYHYRAGWQLEGGVRKSGSGVDALRIGRVAGLPVTRQIEGDEAMIFRDLSLHLIAENATAKRIAMDQQHRYAALAALLDSEGTVRCGHNLLPSRDGHAAILL
jgi:hypothetical protein